MVGHPKWARQMASASSPAALSMLEGLLNPMMQDKCCPQVLPPEVRNRYIASCGGSQNLGARSDAEREFEQNCFYTIYTATDLQRLVRFGLEHGGDSASEPDVNKFAQSIWMF